MRKALLFIASVLLAATASAQIGNPGFGSSSSSQFKGASATSCSANGASAYGFAASPTAGICRSTSGTLYVMQAGPSSSVAIGSSFFAVTSPGQINFGSSSTGKNAGLNIDGQNYSFTAFYTDGGATSSSFNWTMTPNVIGSEDSFTWTPPIDLATNTLFAQYVKQSPVVSRNQFSSGWSGGYISNGGSGGGQSQWSSFVSNLNDLFWGVRLAGIDMYTDHSNGYSYANLSVSGVRVGVQERAGTETDHPVGSITTGQYNGHWEAFVAGLGFSFTGGNDYPNPQPVEVLVTDTTDTVNAGAVWVCGKKTSYNARTTCESLTLVGLPSPGPTTLTTVNSYKYIESVKVVGAGVLDGGGDELIQVRWQTTEEIIASTNLVNHATKGTITIAPTKGNYYDAICEDPNGCNLAFSGWTDGHEFTIVGGAATTDILAADAAGLQLAGGANFTIQPADALHLIYSKSLDAYVEVSRSDN